MFSTRLVCALSIISHTRADFELYRYYDASDIADTWSITDDCLTALNSTVQCDESVTSLLGNGADYNYWYMDNITTLCSTTCQTSLATWGSQVETACDGQTVLYGGAEVEAKALTLTFTYGSGLVCMQDSSDNWCFYDSQNWQGSDYMRWDPEMCMPDGLNDTDIPAICDDEDFDIDDISDDMSSMTNLYDSAFFCDECFLKLFRQRLVDPWLVDSNFTGYLITEFDSIQSNCSTTLPYTTSAATLYIGTATATATAGSVSASTTAITAQATCAGQTVEALNSSLTCNDLSDTYNVSTGDARVYTGDYSCIFTSTVCLPLPCGLDTVWDSLTCAELAASYSNSTYNITETQFLSWNSNIQGSCDGVAKGQRICTEAPGGTFPSPTATIYAQTGTTYYTTATTAYPTQTGTIEDCGKYYLVTSGDDCSTVDLVFGINFTQLQTYNPYLNTNCSNLWLNYDVCVGEVTPPAVSTDGTCGVSVTCEGSDFGDCCSAYGFCGSGSGYCSSITTNGTATTDGTCGPDNGGTTCTNADFGSCCSIYGNCGDGTDYCGAGNCYSGSCDTDTGGPSTNGECGPLFAGNKTCSGTQFGNCCSTSGYCGNETDYCAGSNCYSGLCTT